MFPTVHGKNSNIEISKVIVCALHFEILHKKEKKIGETL